MTTFEYIAGLSLAAAVAILLALVLGTGKNLLLRIGVGVFLGFSAFLIALMITASIGNLYVNTLIASVLLSLMGRNSWG